MLTYGKFFKMMNSLMKRFSLLFCLSILFFACERQYTENPDPNHTHADFAVWVDGEKVDFSGKEHMSGLEDDHDHLHPYLHLHDHIDRIIHQHKPGLILRDFFDSLDFTFQRDREWRMFVNGEEMEFDLDYVFEDMDQIFLTTSSASAQVLYELEQMTDDACRYSQTCLWKGKPPAENCIADPAVPCVAP